VDEKIILTQKEKEVKVEQTVNNAKLVEHEDRMFIDQRFVDGIFSKKWDKNWDSYRRISSCYNGPRNFLTDPVLLIAPGLVNDRNADDCDVPCFHTNQQDANEVLRSDAMLGWDLGGSLNAEPRCPYQRKAHLSMESADYYSSNIIPDDAKDRHNLMMTTELRSNVTVGYYSWVDYGIMDPLDYERKTKSKAVGAAFISNCGDKSGRLDVLKGLIRNGVPIDSMGRCENNAREPAGRGKVDILRDYKFGMAFENTIWEDYVTEKVSPYPSLIFCLFCFAP
jgi:glycoprotein 3-alpha-L-fucosyltransferase